MAKKRKLENWLKSLLECVEDTEAPRLYWLWGGLLTISSALQRRVWIPYGIEDIFPNLYICIVARPGERKAAPISLAKKMLEEVYVPVSVDSSSKRALTEELVISSETQQFQHPDGKPRRMSTLAVISKELGSLLAVDKENMIIALTDLYDCHDSWKYKTSGKGQDFLYNVCLTLFAATTPRYIMNNLPPEAYAEGWASRVAWISERPMYKSVPWPKPFPSILYNKLIYDLHTINGLIGQFRITPEAKAIFDLWYAKIPERKAFLRDERLLGNLNRLHIQVLKVAMVLKVSQSNVLLVEPDQMGQAIDFAEELLATTTKAFGSSGYSRLGPMVDAVKMQVRILKETSVRELMQMNVRNLSKSELEEVLQTLEIMGEIERPLLAEGSLDQMVRKVVRKEGS